MAFDFSSAILQGRFKAVVPYIGPLTTAQIALILPTLSPGVLVYNRQVNKLFAVSDTGTLVPIGATATVAGLEGGIEALGAGVSEETITTGETYIDTNYGISAELENLTDADPTAFILTITNKTTTTFKVRLSGATPNGNYRVSWMSFGIPA